MTVRRVAAWVGALVVAALVIAGSAALAARAAESRATTWTSTSNVVYGARTSDLLLGVSTTPGDPDRTLATQAEVVTGDAVMSRVSEDLGVSVAALRRAVEVEVIVGSNVLTISATADSADEATRRAAAVADSYVSAVRGAARRSLSDQATALDSPIAELRAAIAAAPQRGAGSDTGAQESALTSLVQQQLELRSAAASEAGPANVLASAETPRSPSSVSTTTAAVVGAGLGVVIVLGLGLLVQFGRSRTRRP